MNKPNNIDFNTIIDELDNLCLKLLKMDPVGRRYNTSPEKGISGIYLFSKNGKHVYVGRSKDIHKRYNGHIYSNPDSASFAFLLARDKTGKNKASYKSGPNTRKQLMEDDNFKNAFNEARQQIREMDFRYVEESDSIRQALLEIYCAVKLNAKYTKFGNALVVCFFTRKIRYLRH